MNKVLKYRLGSSDSGQFTGGLFLKRKKILSFFKAGIS